MGGDAFSRAGSDWISRHTPTSGFEGRTTQDRAVLGFIAAHRPSEEADYLRTGGFSIEYQDYDWSLNGEW